MPHVLNPKDALSKDAPIIHENLDKYQKAPFIYPEPNTNIANRTKIRKGNVEEAFKNSDYIVEREFSFPPGDHVAMEPRVCIAEILPDGTVSIISSTQGPYVVRNLMAKFFKIPHHKVIVTSPGIGGGFGGKAGIQLEALAYLLSKKVGGRPVKVMNTREDDLISSPGRIGLWAKVKLGAKSDGTFMAMEILFLFDAGAYADCAVNISRAAAISCTGPYRVPNVKADSLCVYTNHPFATAYRGFGHIELAFPIERIIDILAQEMNMDPVELRIKNAIRKGDTTPTGSLMGESSGNLPLCIKKVSEHLNWSEGARIKISENRVRAKGISCFWKAPAIPTNTDAGAIITINEDSSVNLITGIVEIGQGTHTGLAQIVAEKFKIDPSKVHVVRDVRTDKSPHDWTTAASRSLFMAGKAAIEAAEDAIRQLKLIASYPLRARVDEIEVAEGRVFLKDKPEIGFSMGEIGFGYVFPNGNAIFGQVIGVGRYITTNLTDIDRETGRGDPAFEWTMGSAGFEVEVDLNDGSFKILKAVCVMDVGKVINPRLARGQVVGGMEMAIGYTTTEGFVFDSLGRVLNRNLRDFKIPRFGEHPEYIVEFVETPEINGPYGARGLGEQGVVGVPGALTNALSRAIGKEINHLPLIPENIWKILRGEK